MDLIIENSEKRKVQFIEIKNSHTFRQRMIEPLKKLMLLDSKEQFNKKLYTINGTLLYQGDEQFALSDNISCVNYKEFVTY